LLVIVLLLVVAAGVAAFMLLGDDEQGDSQTPKGAGTSTRSSKPGATKRTWEHSPTTTSVASQRLRSM
jgi:hypothetical protein